MHNKAPDVQESGRRALSNYETGGAYQIVGYCQIHPVIEPVHRVHSSDSVHDEMAHFRSSLNGPRDYN